MKLLIRLLSISQLWKNGGKQRKKYSFLQVLSVKNHVLQSKFTENLTCQWEKYNSHELRAE